MVASRGTHVALSSLGRNTVIADRVQLVNLASLQGDEAAKKEAQDRIDNARKDILGALTPWIPGDFVVTYGILLTAWPDLRNSFTWLLIISALSAMVFVILGAFAESGFKPKLSRHAKLRLLWRTVAGFAVSVYAAAAIPRSGWYDFEWFSKNEQACVLTAGVLTVAIVFILKGLQKRDVITPSPA